MSLQRRDVVDPAGREVKPHSRPAWVKVLGIVAIVVVVAAIAMSLVGENHGPGRHVPGGENAPAQHTPPPGGHD